MKVIFNAQDQQDNNLSFGCSLDDAGFPNLNEYLSTYSPSGNLYKLERLIQTYTDMIGRPSGVRITFYTNDKATIYGKEYDSLRIHVDPRNGFRVYTTTYLQEGVTDAAGRWIRENILPEIVGPEGSNRSEFTRQLTEQLVKDALEYIRDKLRADVLTIQKQLKQITLLANELVPEPKQEAA